MPKKSPLPVTTIMYSVHKQTGDIIVHRLPWGKGDLQLEYYAAKGFTYERPPALTGACPHGPSDDALISMIKELDAAPVPNDGHRILAVTDDNGTHYLEQDKPAADEATRIAAKNLDKEMRGIVASVTCPGCGKVCKPQGIKAHMRFCKKVKV